MGTETATEAEEQLLNHFQDVCPNIDRTDALPVVYSPGYNTSFFGLEKLHPFDSCKFAKVHRALKKLNAISQVPRPATSTILRLRHHPPSAIQQLSFRARSLNRSTACHIVHIIGVAHQRSCGHDHTTGTVCRHGNRVKRQKRC